MIPKDKSDGPVRYGTAPWQEDVEHDRRDLDATEAIDSPAQLAEALLEVSRRKK
jgi:hypothetical protein